MLYTINRITKDYNVILLHLCRLRELADTLGEIGKDIQNDIDKAENQCMNCLYRFNCVDESLKDRDFRYLNNQVIFATRQMKVFDELVQKVRGDALDLAIFTNQGMYKGENEHDL